MTRNQAIEIARQRALNTREGHRYLPVTEADAATWEPHEWVIDAIRWATMQCDLAATHEALGYKTAYSAVRDRASKKLNSAVEVAPTFGDIEIEDLCVDFKLTDATLTKKFVSYAAFYPAASSREDGVCVGDMDNRLSIFMERWKSNGFAVIGDTVVNFSDFVRAAIVRERRTVRVRVRSCGPNARLSGGP